MPGPLPGLWVCIPREAAVPLRALKTGLLMPLACIHNVSLSLGDREILRDVNAEINLLNHGTHGHVIALLGPSGIGKSQLLYILAGLREPTSGTVSLTDRALPVHAGMVGVVFQDYPLFEHRTVLGNLMTAAQQHDGAVRKISEERAWGMLKRFDLTDRATAYPAQLSGGQRQRVAIARQLLCSDHYLLMDEPFSGLDPLMKENTCALISEVAAQDAGNVIIVTTHDIASAVSVADLIWLLGRDRDARGQVVAGARIQAEYNLVDRGLAWHADIAHMPGYAELVSEIRARFRTL